MSDRSDIFCTNEACENYSKSTFNGCKTRFMLCDKETYSQILDLRIELEEIKSRDLNRLFISRAMSENVALKSEIEQLKKENQELREYKSMYEGLYK